MAGTSKKLNIPVIATPITNDGMRTSLHVSVDTRALAALFATAKIENMGEAMAHANRLVEPSQAELPLVGHSHQHQRRALPPPSEPSPQRYGPQAKVNPRIQPRWLLTAIVAIVGRHEEAKSTNITAFLNEAHHTAYVPSVVANGLDRLGARGLLSKKVGQSSKQNVRPPNLWSLTAAGHKALEQEGCAPIPELARKKGSGQKLHADSMVGQIREHLPEGEFTATRLLESLPPRLRPSRGAWQLGIMLCHLNKDGFVRRVGKGTYVRAEQNGASA